MNINNADIDDYFAERRASIGLIRADLTVESLNEVFKEIEKRNHQIAYLRAILRIAQTEGFNVPESVIGGV